MKTQNTVPVWHYVWRIYAFLPWRYLFFLLIILGSWLFSIPLGLLPSQFFEHVLVDQQILRHPIGAGGGDIATAHLFDHAGPHHRDAGSHAEGAVDGQHHLVQFSR